MTTLKLLIVLFAVNGAPIIASRILGARFAKPLDGGAHAWDGRRWLGRTKTWRGLMAALIAGVLCTWIVGWGAGIGVAIALTAMAGDAVSSFVKRRLGRPPSTQFPGLDQIPESLLPAWVIGPSLGMSTEEILVTVAAFSILEIPLSRLLYDLHIRKQPY